MENGQQHHSDADRLRIQQQHQQNTHAGNPSQPVPHQQQQPPFVLSPPQHQQQQIPIPADNLLTQMIHMMQKQQIHYQQQLNQLLLRQQQNEQRAKEWQQTFLRSITSSINVQVPPNPEQILDSLAGYIKEFHYEAESNLTFACWYSRYDDLFEKDVSRLDDEAKVRLLLRKMGTVEHERYVSYILPRLPKDFSFAQTVEKLKGLFGHREGYCTSAKKSRGSAKKRKKFSVTSKVVVVKACSVDKRRKFVPVLFPGGEIRLQLDTASDITVISKKNWPTIGSPVLAPATVKAKTDSGNVLPLVGEFSCNVSIAKKTHKAVIRVTEKHLQLLGSDLVDSFDLGSVPMDTFCCQVSSAPVSTNSLKKTFPKVFSEELGLCHKIKVKLNLKEQCNPVFCPKRPVAYAMQDAVNQELDRLEKINIISPVDYLE
ncbi:uncharacterized protein K02A2.6-like [Toxorhynchites rutilus septentrionalis]|uniref:uncharacterized protein K02A2.6-like n=1 Tax=Toxorhynchites rutilus septentrionalis TaxID=329112 RepID=UPI0024793E3A|nr:uncharacterized protein K02A2.6-like [Toxorhynchites rutilus septentrionalis]